jgi:glucose-6-phosphate 1-dehydrogenase
MNKTPGLDRSGLKLSQVALDLDLHEEFAAHRRRIAYERLYLDAIEGNGTCSCAATKPKPRGAGSMRSSPAGRRKAWRRRPYPAGTWGPGSAVTLTERHGHSWRE